MTTSLRLTGGSQTQFQAALEGNLDAFEEGVRLSWLRAVRTTSKTIERRGVNHLRGMMDSAGLQGLRNTWRGEVFPKNQLAYEPAILLYSNAEVIVSAFNEGATIRSRGTGGLALPIPGSPAEDFPNPRGPDDKVDYARKRFGDQLVTVPPRNGRPGLLILEGGAFSKTGKLGARKRTKTGKFGSGTASVPLFFLVREVRLDRRLDIQQAFDQIADDYIASFPRELATELQREGLNNADR